MNKKNLYIILIALMAIFILFGGYWGYQAYQKYVFKELLQLNFDLQYYNKERGNFCYVVGENINFPYQQETTFSDEFYDEYKKYQISSSNKYYSPNFYGELNKYRLNQILPVFNEIGLLDKKSLSPESSIDEYYLTDEGKKYVSMISDTLIFCYGRQIVNQVTDIIKEPITSGKTKGMTKIDVKYSFTVDDFPKWAGTTKLFQAYYPLEFTDLSKGEAYETFIQASDGVIYIGDNFNSHFVEPFYPRSQ